MNRIDRLNAILIQLQSKKIVKAQEIADRFEISLRTVYRDIRALEEAGIPIGAEAGIGYFLSDDFSLPPVVFTKEEASAFLLAGKLVTQLSDIKVSKAFESALYKVKSVLKIADKEHLDQLDTKITVYNRAAIHERENNLFLQEIQSALASKRVLKLEYTAKYNQQTTERFVEPVSLCNYDMRWHLIALCRLRNDYRDFRLDRITALHLLDETYNDNNHLSLNDYFKRMTEENHLHTIQLTMHKTTWESIGSAKYWFGLINEQKEDDHYHMTFTHNNLNLFAKWVLSMGKDVEILKPLELKQLTKQYIQELYEHYNLPVL